jgi:TetR/AcrR family transcriptional regulator, mexCD-oprJ operon repressor
MRADAARNVQRIVEAAAPLLAADPHLGMADVAAAASVSRATVYRHFATREALLSAIYEHSVAQGEASLHACRLGEGSAGDALRRLIGAWLDVSERYGFPQLVTHADFVASEAMREHRRRVLGEPLVALLRRGRASGEFSSPLSPEWAAAVFGALLLAGARAVAEGTLAREDAPDVVHRTLLEGLGGGAHGGDVDG